VQTGSSCAGPGCAEPGCAEPGCAESWRAEFWFSVMTKLAAGGSLGEGNARPPGRPLTYYLAACGQGLLGYRR